VLPAMAIAEGSPSGARPKAGQEPPESYNIQGVHFRKKLLNKLFVHTFPMRAEVYSDHFQTPHTFKSVRATFH